MWRKVAQRRLNAKKSVKGKRKPVRPNMNNWRNRTNRYTGYSAKKSYRYTAKKISDIQTKMCTSYAHRWDSKASNNYWYVEEICPFKREQPFWTKDGGLSAQSDCSSRNLFVRGGEWKLSITNKDNSDAIVTCYLGFCLDGTDYKTMAGDINVPWSPYLGFEDIGKRYKISKWKKHFVLKCNPATGYGSTKLFTFKIGQFPVDVNRFIAEKKGWPFVWVTWKGVENYHVKMTFDMECTILFTDNMPHAMSSREIADIKEDLKRLTNAMYAVGDAEMAPAQAMRQ